MNPGKLRERAAVLRLVGEADLRWEKLCGVWLSAKETGRKNLFSKVGIGTAGAEFLLRERGLTLHDAILWRGQHYLLTDIAREGTAPVYLRVQAARVTPVIALHYRRRVALGELNRPEQTTEQLGSFPCCLTEKYLGSSDENSHVESRARLVAVTPKAVRCIPGDLLEIEDEQYRVMVVHQLEIYKNELEIERTSDD